MTRKSLVTLVLAMFGALLMAFALVFFTGLAGPGESTTISASQRFSDLEAGQTIMRRFNGQRVWLTRPSAQQLQRAVTLDAHLLDPASGCKPKLAICALAAATARDGIELRYTALVPPQLPVTATWIGGFVDPTTGAVFDLFGRAYRIKLTGDTPGMTVVDINN